MKIILFCLMSLYVFASDLSLGDPAPLFSAKTQEGKTFELASRKGKWTVLYFYPKAGTKGCTQQACAFRDSIAKIRAMKADVFGVSTDTVEKQAEFHKDQHLNFTLLADPDQKVVGLYGSKMPLLNLSKRWTFILDPELKIRHIMKDVDPAADSERVAQELARLQARPSSSR